MQLRHVSRPGDIRALEDLFETITTCDGHAPIGEHKYLDLLHAELDQVTGIVAEDDGVIAYVAVSPTQDRWTWGLEVAVHPLHRDQETIRTLVDAGSDHAERRGARRMRIWTFQPKLAAVLEDAGFQPERELRQLRIALPAEQPRFPETVEVRPFEVGSDEEAWLAVNNAAFSGHPENGAWTMDVLADRQRQSWFDPKGFRMAWEDGELVGFCWTKVADHPIGEIYVIGVAPGHQGRGLGKALILEGLRYLNEEVGLDRGMLYVDAGNEKAVAVYERLGFRLDHVDRSFVRDL